MQAKTTSLKPLTRKDKMRKTEIQSPAEGTCARVLSSSVASPQCDPVDCGLPGASVHGSFQARILESVAVSSCRGSS